jgi:hypothetical protein
VFPFVAFLLAAAIDLQHAVIAARFASDPVALKSALSLYESTGSIADVFPEQMFDGGYRGIVHLVPAVPLGNDRKHIAWVAGAYADFDAFFAGLAAHGTPRYRWHALTFRFFRSVGNTTPNALASGWTIAYNVNGSINTSATAVRETLFHETFHLNDADHGDWSASHVGAIQAAIRQKCGARTACLTPYAPTATIVRNGTYYAFQPGNDAEEYAAEVASRYYREQRAILRGDPAVRPAFKCGPPENKQAWEAISQEFFGAVDLVGPC